MNFFQEKSYISIKFSKSVASNAKTFIESNKNALKIKTTSEVKHFQDKKEYDSLLKKLFDVVKSMDNSQLSLVLQLAPTVATPEVKVLLMNL